MNTRYEIIVGNRSRLGTIIAAALYLCVCGCAVGPKYQRPAVAPPAAYKEPLPSGWKEAQPQDGKLRGKWWEVFHDPDLNALEDQVSVTNQNVLAAEAQYRAAKYAVRIARTALFPTVSTAPTITDSRSPSNFSAGGQVSSTSGVRNIYNLPFSSSYELDVWGSIRRSLAQTTANAQVTAADLENARLLYHAALAQDYFQLHGLDGDEQLLTNTVDSYREYLDLTRNRYRGGVASQGDVAQAETQLETTRAQLVDIGVQRAQLEHAIAILIGKPPAEFSIPPAPIRSAPPQIPVGMPSTLLERRPDIAAAERQVAAANEQIGITRAALYPTFAFAASTGLERSNFLNWLTWPSRFWSIGPQLGQVLFDTGRRHIQIDQAQAAYDATAANYRQSVLNAFQQVEDNLSALRILEQEAKIQDAAVKASRQSVAIATAQYKGGVVSYLQVITSQTIALQDERAALDILTRRMVASVGLIEALGGGWDTSQLPDRGSMLAMGN